LTGCLILPGRPAFPVVPFPARLLADTVRDKIIAKRTVVAEAKGPINIKVVPLGSGGFDVDITITTMSR